MRALLPLSTGLRSSGSVPTLWLDGDVDVTVAHELAARTDVWLSAMEVAPQVVLDVSRVTFIDLSGLRALLLLRDRLASHDCRVALRGAPPCVRRLMLITGHDEAFEPPSEAPSSPPRLVAVAHSSTDRPGRHPVGVAARPTD